MKPILIRTTLIVVFLSLPILIAECFLKLYFPIYTVAPIEAYRYDEEFGVLLKSGIHLFRTTDYQEEIRTNKIGTVNFQESFSEYDQLIFAIGDSYTQGTGVPIDASYPFQLDLMLNTRNKNYVKKYAVVNLGFGAFGGEEAILTLLKYKELIGSPRYILFLGCDNDYEDDLLFKSGYRYNHLVEGNPRWGVWLKPLQWFTHRTEIGKRLKLAISTVRRNKIFNGKVLSMEKTDVAVLQRPVLDKLLNISKKLQSTLIVSWANPSESYQSLKDWAGEHHVQFADWYPLVQSVQKSMPALSLDNQHSGGHHRTWVNQMIAQAFEQHIV